MRRSDRPIRAMGIGIGIMLVLAACGGGNTAPTSSAASPTSPATSSGSPTAEAAEIEWYVGLGTGENEEQIPREEAVVKAFNDAHPNIHLKLTVVDNTEAADTLATRIGAGDAPDIIGPIGIRGLQSFGDQLLDLAPYIKSSGVDLSQIDQSLIDVYNVGGKQIGIPMAVYSSFIYYNKTLFDEAGVDYPPHKVGDKYDGKDWTWDTVRDLAMKLTVDKNGNDATSVDFDADAIEQYGLDAQFTENDARAWATIFGGSGSVLADDGKTAQWPDNWRAGLQYYYDGVWKDHFIPDKTAVDALAAGNTFQSGLIAMDVVHQWYTCCIYPTEGKAAVTDWDIAVLPVGPDGKITSKLHADTIGIMDSTEHPDAAFEALTYLTASPELIQTWGAMPAVESQRADFFAGLDKQFAPLDIDWSVSEAMLGYPDKPSHESFMPNFAEADSANKDLGSQLWTTSGLDLKSVIDKHVETLQSIFDKAT
ncbi:MAG TPA: extracellular solute-binding protein [Candidatus Limnocylindria bacterium]|nr:extracellular solute-binding protein [Candidatus Limnocylindria bacterium]